MEIFIGIFTVIIIITSVLIVISILFQEDKSGGGMGILGGSSQSFFGASSGNILTKITSIFLVIFFISGIAISILCSTATSETTITEEDIQKKQYENRTLVNTKTDYIEKKDSTTDNTKK